MPDNRQSVRHSVNLTATVVVGGETHQSKLLNLSLGGALMTHADRLPMGDRVEVEFSIPTQKEPIVVGSAVRWSTETAIGVQFDGLRAREVWSLNKYFETLDE